MRKNTLILGLAFRVMSWKAKIERRVDTMLAAGLEQEVRELSNDSLGWWSQ